MNPACPECKSTDSIPIAYGLPTPEAFAQAEAGEVALGGCSIWENMPDRQCRACGNKFRSDPALQKRYDDQTEFQLARIRAYERGNFLLVNARDLSSDDSRDALGDRYRQLADAINRMLKDSAKKEKPPDTSD